MLITHNRQPLGDPVRVAAPLRVSLDAVTADATRDKIDKLFMPGPLEVQMGIRVHFPNHDHVRHQVYSFSLATRQPLSSNLATAMEGTQLALA